MAGAGKKNEIHVESILWVWTTLSPFSPDF